jgi:hypothetical protein
LSGHFSKLKASRKESRFVESHDPIISKRCNSHLSRFVETFGSKVYLWPMTKSKALAADSGRKKKEKKRKTRKRAKQRKSPASQKISKPLVAW